MHSTAKASVETMVSLLAQLCSWFNLSSTKEVNTSRFSSFTRAASHQTSYELIHAKLLHRKRIHTLLACNATWKFLFTMGKAWEVNEDLR